MISFITKKRSLLQLISIGEIDNIGVEAIPLLLKYSINFATGIHEAEYFPSLFLVQPQECWRQRTKMDKMGVSPGKHFLKTLGAHGIHKKIPSSLPFFFQNGEELVVTPYLITRDLV